MKTKAFTILEALISLMLISIMIGLTYTIINLVGKQLALFSNENSQVIEYNLFDSTLLLDIDKAVDMDYDDGLLSLKNYDESRVNYRIVKPYVIRQITTQTDTFKIGVKSHDIKVEKNNGRQIKQLLLKITFLKDTINTNYYLEILSSESINEKFFDEN